MTLLPLAKVKGSGRVEAEPLILPGTAGHVAPGAGDVAVIRVVGIVGVTGGGTF